MNNPDIIGFAGGLHKSIKEPFDYNRFKGELLSRFQEEYSVRQVQCVEGSSMLIPVSSVIEKDEQQKNCGCYQQILNIGMNR